MEKINILGVNVDKVTRAEAGDIIFSMLEDRKANTIFTPNAEIIMKAYKDEEFKNVLNSADLLCPDGIGVVYASKILDNPISERASGYDIACDLIEKISKSGHKLFLFGGIEGVAQKAKENLEKQYPFIQIVGTQNGYFKPEKDDEICDKINSSRADIVFVCLGAPKQEMWINKNKDKLNAKVLLGIGGSLDVLAGEVKRAPDFWVKYGLEWLYRLIKQPSRFKRMLALPRFALTVLFKGDAYENEE